MHWYLEVFRKYAVFKGRARRKEYWIFFLFSAVIYMAFALMDEAMGWKVVFAEEPYGFLSTLHGLAITIPSLAVFVRRLHDTDRSGWWWFIGLIPLIGVIILLVFLVRNGTRGENRYGPDPKAVQTQTW